MSQAYKVSQAFQATVSKEDKTPKTVTFNGHTFNAWKVKVENQEDFGVEGDQWINVNKQPGNEIKVGDEIYGDIDRVDGKFGSFYNFKYASRPLGQAPNPASTPGTQAPAEDFTANVSTELVHDKLDYIIDLLEKLVDPATGEVKQSAPDLADLDI